MAYFMQMTQNVFIGWILSVAHLEKDERNRGSLINGQGGLLSVWERRQATK